jgi:UTP--glucose-1-phosphate uridylyltransferase
MAEEIHYLVIPAAGLGTRMRRVNPDMPKEMLPILNKPAIQYSVEEGLAAGIKDIVIIINKNKEIIRSYFEDKRSREQLYPLAAEAMEEIVKVCRFTFLYQKEPLGEMDAISLSRNIVGNNAIAIIYPDNIYFPAPGALRILKDVYLRFRTDVSALMKVTEENARGISNSGKVDVLPLEKDIYNITKFYPKGDGYFVPRFKYELRTCGFSILGPYIFEYIERARAFVKEGEFTDEPFRILILKEKGYLGYALPGMVFDIGNPEGYRLCLRSVGNTGNLSRKL